jgi:4-amino-4-deoxy-L-arabinose transferase-like glycosyltransferase
MSISDAMKRVSYRRAVPWLGLACLLILYVLSVLRLHPANFFGLTQDDTIYFSSAKALAAGKGYILPNLPGTPPATKYPILYPWILSWVWRWNPTFPANLSIALGITLVFGIAYVAAAFLFLRRLRGIGDAEALLLTAFCAFHPTILFYSASVLSDIPFSALALGTLLVANNATRREAGQAGALGCGILTGLSMLLRVLGVPIAAGILIAALTRRAWKQAAILAACITPFLAWMAWRAVAAGQTTMPAGFDSAGPAFRRTWIYYTSYFGFRRLSMANTHLVETMLLSQMTYFFTELPAYFLSPLFHRNIVLLFVCTVAVFWTILAGMVRQARRAEWQPIHFALPFTVAVILSWDYPEVQRFLIPFLPLLAASLWLEGKWIAAQLAAALRVRRSAFERAFAAGLGVAMCACGLGIAWNFVADEDRAAQRRSSIDRAALFAEKREAYDWLRQNAPEDARVVAGEDGSLYLYTGRQAMAHIALQRAGAYDETYMQEDLKHMTDVAKAIGAQYWLAASDDSDKQWVAAKPFLTARFSEIENAVPEVFRSSGGHVRIYGLGCVQHPEVPACQAADRVLFPIGSENPSP